MTRRARRKITVYKSLQQRNDKLTSAVKSSKLKRVKLWGDILMVAGVAAVFMASALFAYRHYFDYTMVNAPVVNNVEMLTNTADYYGLREAVGSRQLPEWAKWFKMQSNNMENIYLLVIAGVVCFTGYFVSEALHYRRTHGRAIY